MGISAQQHRLTTGSYLNSGCPIIKRPKGQNCQTFTSFYKLRKTKLLLGAVLGILLCHITILSLHYHVHHAAVNTGLWSLLLYIVGFCSDGIWNLTLYLGASTSASKKEKSLPSAMFDFVRCAPTVTFWVVCLNLTLVLISNMSLLNPGPGKTNKNVSVVYHNVRGLVPFTELRKKNRRMLDTTKLHELNSFVYEKEPDIVILNETWLSKEHLDEEILPTSAYKIFRLDRSRKTHPPDPNNLSKFKENGGGVLIAVSTGLDAESKRVGTSVGAEILSVKVKFPNGKCMFISTCYRVGTAGEPTCSAIREHLAKIAKMRDCKKHLLIGDFNLNKVTWPGGNTTCENQQGVLDVLLDVGFEQLVDKPTHLKGNTLDLVLSNTPDFVSNISIKDRDHVCTSDHLAITFELGPAKRKTFPKHKIYNFKKANWKGLISDLMKIDWKAALQYCDSETAWANFKTILFALCDKHIPKITVQFRFKSPWFDSESYALCREKERLRQVHAKSGKPEDYAAFARKRKEYKRLIDEKMRSSFKDEDDPALITKKLWSFVKRIGKSCRIPEIVSYGTRFRSDSRERAELFNEFFCDQFSDASLYEVDIDFSNDWEFDIEFDPQHVANLLRKMNANKAQGPDGIHGHILKNCASALAYPLSLIYKTSYNTGSIPREWKTANVVPVHKKGSKSLVDNYRPISLTCLVMKIFEIQVRDTIMTKTHHLLDWRQHGFLPSRSCTTQMVPFIDTLAQTINASSRRDVIYFDFMKAFDSVNHDLILSKLKRQYGIDGRLLKLMVNYLQDRTQCVVVDGVSSGQRPVQSGVPQGSILGPLLFVMFINDMFQCISSGTDIALYADDTKISRQIDSWSDHVILQQDIDALHLWSVNNKMKFHPVKCKVLHVTLNQLETPENTPLPFCIFSYQLNGVYLDSVDQEKDLGILVGSKLSWTNHHQAVFSKASSRLGLVKRTCHFTVCPRQKRSLYLALVRSLFEHLSVVWSPCSSFSVAKLERIQRRAVKWILGELGHHYNDVEYIRRLKALDLLPLDLKFIQTDLLLFHDIVYNISTIHFPDYIVRAEHNDITNCRLRQNINPPLFPAGHELKYDMGALRTESTLDYLSYKVLVDVRVNVFKNSFFVRTLRRWNELPINIRKIESPDGFKAAVITHLWSKCDIDPNG